MKLNYYKGKGLEVGFSGGNIIRPETDYQLLINKPMINSVELNGNVSAADLGLGAIYYDTTANWDSQRTLIAEAGVVYIYSDAIIGVDEFGNQIPLASIKVGDGTSYLIDMPFITGGSSEIILDHLANGVIHVSELDREFWDNKVSAYLAEDDHENLVLSKVDYVVDGDIMGG